MSAVSSSSGGSGWTRSAIGLGVVLAILVTVAAWAFWLSREDPAKAAGPATPQAVPVQIATATQENVPIYLSGLGIVQAFNTVTVRARVDGELQNVLFTEGQIVKKGDLLAVIDPRPFQAALDEAIAKVAQDQANLANAQLMLSRDTKLQANQFVPTATVDTQRTTVTQLQQQLALDEAAKSDAATQLSYTQLTSPLDGRTGVRLVDQGNIVHATDQTGIVVITQLQPISVISTLSQDDLPLVRDALSAGSVPVTAFTTDGVTNLGSGTLSLVDNQIDQATGTIRLKSTFPNTQEKLWPGQSVEIRVVQRVQPNAVTVPSPALQRGEVGFFVYVVGADETVRARPIKPGQIAGGRAVIETGLAAGERVVTAGQYRLEPGTRISVESPPSAAPGPTGPGAASPASTTTPTGG